MKPNNLKRALKQGEVQIGTWVNTLSTPKITQILATAGFNFIYIDMEHSSFSIETVGELCFAALLLGLTPIVRPPAKDFHLLSRPLDAGAMGLLIPHSNEVAMLMHAATHAVEQIRAFAEEEKGERV